MFWVTDNFLMRNKRKVRPNGTIAEPTEVTLFERVKVRYRSLQSGSSSRGGPQTLTGIDDTDSDALASDLDEELLLDRAALMATVSAISLSSSDNNGNNGGANLESTSASASKTIQRNSVSSLT